MASVQTYQPEYNETPVQVKGFEFLLFKFLAAIPCYKSLREELAVETMFEYQQYNQFMIHEKRLVVFENN